MQWFLERGFEERSVEALPESRRDIYNWQRKSKIYMKVRTWGEGGRERGREGGREGGGCGGFVVSAHFPSLTVVSLLLSLPPSLRRRTSRPPVIWTPRNCSTMSR